MWSRKIVASCLFYFFIPREIQKSEFRETGAQNFVQAIVDAEAVPVFTQVRCRQCKSLGCLCGENRFSNHERYTLHGNHVEIIEQAIHDKAFPGCTFAIIENGVVTHLDAYGTLTYDDHPVTILTRYDLASLTKVLATTLACMKLVEDGKLKLTETVIQLLSHTSGFPADVPRGLNRKAIWNFIETTPLEYAPGTSCQYSDIDFILLGKMVEDLSGMSLDQYVKIHFYDPLGLSSISFDPLPAAPTEYGLTGRVHDEKAAELGVSGHAGLFSDIQDIARIMQMLFNGGEGLLKPEIIDLFLRYQDPFKKWHLGWARGNDPSSFYHLGFTGTGIWADLDKKWCMILLTNRVYPTRENIKIRAVRQALLDELQPY